MNVRSQSGCQFGSPKLQDNCSMWKFTVNIVAFNSDFGWGFLRLRRVFTHLKRVLVMPLSNEVYWIYLVRPSVRPSVCRRHGFRSISQVYFGMSISNFICMLMVAIGRNLLIFSDVTFKMAAWRPYWIFWFPYSNFTLALNINFKLQQHNTYVYG